MSSSNDILKNLSDKRALIVLKAGSRRSIFPYRQGVAGYWLLEYRCRQHNSRLCNARTAVLSIIPAASAAHKTNKDNIFGYKTVKSPYAGISYQNNLRVL